jgi:hypothetical protein
MSEMRSKADMQGSVICHYANDGGNFSPNLCSQKSSKMRAPIPLHEVTGKLLDPHKWQQIRKLTSSEMEALCSLNAPAPEGAADFFWKGSGSDADARRCYRISKSLLEDCRLRFMKGTLVASGENRNGVRKLVPADWWGALYPLFATDRIQGRTRQFTNVEVYDAADSVAPGEAQLNDCIAWMKQRKIEGISEKKPLWRKASDVFGTALTTRMFENCYKAVFDRGRGRPFKSMKQKTN